MPRQQGDPAFVAEEKLYRRLRDDWIDVNGDTTEDAIDLHGTSVDRGRFRAEPADCLAGAAPNLVAVAVIMFDDIPNQFEAPPAKPCDSVVVYLPLSNNVAHSEIRFCRPGETENSKPGSPALKSQIRGLLAERLLVVYRPDSGQRRRAPPVP